jgi:ribonuclease HII
VTRDRIMHKCHADYPVYGFDRHKGYGCQAHMDLIKLHGPCPFHRKSFRGVK